MEIEYAALTDTGQVRENNEDSYGDFVPEDEKELRESGVLFLVADGMGGHRGGETASRVAVSTIRDTYYSAAPEGPTDALRKAFQDANAAILGESAADPTLFGMGTTCTAMAIQGGNAYFGHVGDSRAYLLREGEFKQLTNDHSLVGEMVRSGIISDEDARTHPKRHVITRSLGVQSSIAADTPETPMPVRAGDTFVICSDGLTGYAEDEDIRKAIESSEPRGACESLVSLANSRGGRDNITVIVVKIKSL